MTNKPKQRIDSKEVDAYMVADAQSIFAERVKGLSHKATLAWVRTNEREYYMHMRNQIRLKLNADLKRQRAKFWMDTMSAGNIEIALRKLGIEIREDRSWVGRDADGNVGSSIVMKYFFDNAIVPMLAKEFNIHGVKLKKNATVNSHNLLTWEDAYLIDPNQPEGEPNDQ